jgi:hypothetical protein
MKFFCVLCLLCTAAFAAEPDRFVISFWNGPPPAFISDGRVKEIKEANFNLLLPSFGATVDQNRELLGYCEANGLKAIVMDRRMVYGIANNEQNRKQLDEMIKDYADYPALDGYFIADEPGAHAFTGLGEVVAHLKAKDPNHVGFINLLPTYARNFNALGTKTYEEYVSTYARTVKPFVLCYDHYHLTNSGDRADFFENLQTIRKVSLETTIPFWNIVLVTQHGDYRNLTEAELRFEAMQTLAFGGKGLLWFTYWSPKGSDNSTEWNNAMIDENGKRTPHYDMVKRINAQTLAVGDELFPCASTAVTLPALGEKGVAHGLTVGTFKHPSGKTLMLIANADYKQPAKAKPPADAKGAEAFDPATRSWSAAEATMQVPPGGAVLLRW